MHRQLNTDIIKTKATSALENIIDTLSVSNKGKTLRIKKQIDIKPIYFKKNGEFLEFDKDIANELITYLLNLTKCEDLYDNELPLSYLKKYMSTLREIYNNESDKEKLPKGFSQLIEFIGKQFQKDIEIYEKMMSDKNLTYKQLESYFTIGSLVFYNDGFENIGMKVLCTNYDTYSKKFIIIGEFIKNTKKNNKIKISKDIPLYFGIKNVSELSVKIADDNIKNLFIERSKKIIKYTGINHVRYNGAVIINMHGRRYSKKINSRIMLDNEKYNDLHGYYDDGDNDILLKKDIIEEIENLDDNLFITYPYLEGYAFNEKIWGEFKIEHISDIEYREHVFDLLVLDDKKKKLIKTLINNVSSGFKDIVENKSGGCIILLKGKPGTGKTLTAETAAEAVKKPLYIVSSGELGTTPPAIEEQLNNIILLASKWNAVLLIDEADVFMEKRETGDVLRNAIIGIFLRCLERYDGIMFLTTNRSDTFDPAFLSRISVEVNYPDLDILSRGKIWKNLLSVINIVFDDDKYTLLAEYDINGRQIKNTIRIAQCLAKDNNKDLDYDIIKFVLDDNLTKMVK
jgi:hypothetical protein